MSMRFGLLLLSLNRNISWKLCFERNSKNHLLFQTCSRHTGAYSQNDSHRSADTLRPLKVTSFTRKTQYEYQSPGTAKNKTTRRTHKQIEFVPEEFDEDPLGDTVSKYSTKYAARNAEEDHTRTLIGKMKQMRYKTIERNFFRKPQTPNLLTWAAKEQIRYLHRTDPEEWNIHNLSELFPVSRKDIKRIIDSTFPIFRVQDIIEHDLDVQKNWSDLKSSLEDKGNATTEHDWKAFRNSENNIVIENAVGIKELPFPMEKNFDKFYHKGQFSAIVKDCYDVKEEALMKKREELHTKSEHISEILSNVSQIFQMKTEEKLNKSRFMKSTINSRNSEAGHSERLTTERNINKVDYVNQKGMAEETMYTFSSQKYKDTPVTSQPEEPGVRRNAPYKVNVPQAVQGKTSNDTFVHGDSVYDSNGMFLYRIP